MRQYLNNPWVVLGLCVMAVVILYLNVDEEVVQKTIPRSVLPAGLSKVSGLNVQEENKAILDYAQLDWPTTLNRDPFAPMSLQTGESQGSENYDGEQGFGGPGSPEALPVLQLTAVALEPEPKVAMINRKLVVEGDRIEGLRVARIESDGVWLKGPSGPHHLLFAGSPQNDRHTRESPEISVRPTNTVDEDRKPRKETVLMDGRDCSRSSTCS